MADISKITLPNGQQYSIKDQTARNTGKVSGVKGDKESSYRTGNVNLTPENIGAYKIGATVSHRNSENISANPVYAELTTNKNALDYQALRAVAGIGDWFYAAHLNPDFNITSNYSGKNGTKGNFAISTLFNPSAASTVTLDVDAIAETPFVLTIEKVSGGNITATDVVHLELWDHILGSTNGRLTDYKVELLTTGNTFSSGTYTWQTVYERHNVQDKINGLSITLNSTTYSYLYFRGLRFTIEGAIPDSTSSSAWNYNVISMSLFRLMDQRPAFSVARAMGALDLAGGEIFGPVKVDNTLTATSFNGSLNGNAATATNASKVNNHTVNSDVPSDAVFTDTTDLGSMTGSLTVDHLSPIMSKTFTGIIGTANYDVDCTFFFGTIKPTSYYDIWKIKYRIKVHITGTASPYNQYAQAKSEATWFGSENTHQAYHHLNHIHNTSYRPVYYNTLYSLKKAGIDAGLGHALGIGLRNSWKAYDASYPRQVTIQILQCENCQFAFLDNMVKWTRLPDFNTTNYQTYRQTDFSSNGLQETGDANDPNYQNRVYYTANGTLKTYAAGGRNTLTFTKNQNYILPITATDNLINGQEKVYTTESFNPFGEIYYRSASSSIAANVNIGNYTLYRQILVDARYSFTGILNGTDSIMSTGNTIYLVCQPQSDGFVKLATNPLAFELPQVEDGLYYILLGYAYNTYQFELLLHHPVFMFKNGAVREVSGYSHYAGDANTVTGHTVNSNVPANAEFTDTVTTATTVGSGNAVTAISASNGALTVTKDTIFATKQESQNHVVASTTQPEGQVAGDIWLVIQE